MSKKNWGRLAFYPLFLLFLSGFTTVFVAPFKEAYRAALPDYQQLPNVVKLEDFCSGFVIGQGVVATADHCVEDRLETGDPFINVIFPSGRRSKFYIGAHGQVNENDWAFLYGDTGDVQPFPIADQDAEVGERCYSVGYGGGSHVQMLSPCEIAPPLSGWEKYLALFAEIRPGDSGSPLINENGEIIGITVRSSFPIPASLAVRVSYMKEGLKQISGPMRARKSRLY